MSKLKERILESAWQLFREKGYEKVSLRAIAEHAGTTIGNLTYHYPQKEDLLVAMQMFTQGEALRKFGTLPEDPIEILKDLHDMADQTEQIVLERAVYFNSIFKLAEDVPSLRGNIEETRKIVFEIYMNRFDAAVQGGLMRSDIPRTVYVNITYAMILCISSWLFVREKFHDEASTASIAAIMRNVMQPCLTERGREVWERIESEREESD